MVLILLPQANNMYGTDSVASSQHVCYWFCCLKPTCMVLILLPQANKMYGTDSFASSKQNVWYWFCCLKQTKCMLLILLPQENNMHGSVAWSKQNVWYRCCCLKHIQYCHHLVVSQRPRLCYRLSGKSGLWTLIIRLDLFGISQAQHEELMCTLKTREFICFTVERIKPFCIHVATPSERSVPLQTWQSLSLD